jgi:hypothetical protein
MGSVDAEARRGRRAAGVPVDIVVSMLYGTSTISQRSVGERGEEQDHRGPERAQSGDLGRVRDRTEKKIGIDGGAGPASAFLRAWVRIGKRERGAGDERWRVLQRGERECGLIYIRYYNCIMME